MSTYRNDLPDIMEKIVYHAMQKDTVKRYKMGLNMAADLSLAFDYLEQPAVVHEPDERKGWLVVFDSGAGMIGR